MKQSITTFQRVIIFILVLLIAPGILVAQDADSLKKLPPVNWSRTRTIDVKHVALDLRFDRDLKQAYGTATITLSPFSKISSISLDAGMLSINSVSLSSNKKLQFNYDGGDANDGLKITLDKIYEPGEDVTVVIDYHTNWQNISDPNNLGGSLGKGIRFIRPTSTAPTKRKQIWSIGETASNRYWFPSYDDINDLRTTEFKATVGSKMSVLSNGTLVGIVNNNDGTHTVHWKMDRPYPNYLTSFVVGEYVDVKQTFDDITLHTWAYPDETTAAKATTERLPDMVRYFTELTGIKYPYPTYSQVMVQDIPFPALTGQSTLVTISDNMIDDYRTHKDFLYLWDGVEAEGLASQWFGNLLTPRDWSHAWLSKSFCRYFDGLYTSYKNGKDEYLLWYLMSFDNPAILGDWAGGYRHPIVTRHYEAAEVFSSDTYVKLRGSLVLRMLRRELGDESWWRAIRHYVKTNAGKQVTTEDFQAAIEESTGQSVGWFFDQWIYRMGLPSFEVSKDYDSNKKLLTLRVKQAQHVDPANEYPQVEFFKGKLDIEIDGQIETVWLEPKTENVFTFTNAQAPRFVNFDYESMWIKEISFIKSTDELINQLAESHDITARWNALDELTAIAKDEKTPAADKSKIVSAFRTIVSGKSYWRLRNQALVKLRGLITPPYDDATISVVQEVIKRDSAWAKASAISFLGTTKDPKYADIYIDALNDESDRVINTAAIALGRSKSPKAFGALVKLKDKPSWKSQSLISTLNGLQQLGDPGGAEVARKALADIHSPRWFLAVPVWDYPVAAAQTLKSLGKGSTGYTIVFDRFKKAMKDDDVNDLFSQLLLLSELGDPRGQQAFDMVRMRFKDDPNAMVAIEHYETLFKQSISK